MRLALPPTASPCGGPSGVTLECGGVTVRLERGFDAASLTRALRAIADAGEGLPC